MKHYVIVCSAIELKFYLKISSKWVLLIDVSLTAESIPLTKIRQIVDSHNILNYVLMLDVLEEEYILDELPGLGMLGRAEILKNRLKKNIPFEGLAAVFIQQDGYKRYYKPRKILTVGVPDTEALDQVFSLLSDFGLRPKSIITVALAAQSYARNTTKESNQIFLHSMSHNSARFVFFQNGFLLFNRVLQFEDSGRVQDECQNLVAVTLAYVIESFGIKADVTITIKNHISDFSSESLQKHLQMQISSLIYVQSVDQKIFFPQVFKAYFTFLQVSCNLASSSKLEVYRRVIRRKVVASMSVASMALSLLLSIVLWQSMSKVNEDISNLYPSLQQQKKSNKDLEIQYKKYNYSSVMMRNTVQTFKKLWPESDLRASLLSVADILTVFPDVELRLLQWFRADVDLSVVESYQPSSHSLVPKGKDSVMQKTGLTRLNLTIENQVDLVGYSKELVKAFNAHGVSVRNMMSDSKRRESLSGVLHSAKKSQSMTQKMDIVWLTKNTITK